MLDKLFKYLKPATYNYIYDKERGLDSQKTHIGVMAQDIIEGIQASGEDYKKYSIIQDDGERYSVDYVQLIPILIKELHRLNDKIEVLEKRSSMPVFR